MLKSYAVGDRVNHSGRPGTITYSTETWIMVRFDEGDFMGSGMQFSYWDYDFKFNTWWVNIENKKASS